MNTHATNIDTLVECVQAARDGIPDDSLFAKQCDLVLKRAAQELPWLIVVRAPWPIERGLRLAG